jgi:hypothetical protein
MLMLSVARQAASSAGFTCFQSAPFVRCALQVRRFSALAGDLTLFGPVYRRKTAIFFGHMVLTHRWSSLISLSASTVRFAAGHRVQPMCRDVKIHLSNKVVLNHRSPVL